MSRSKLDDHQKGEVVFMYKNGGQQTAIAKHFDVSPRTINRVLIERGWKSPNGPQITADQEAILRIVSGLGLNAENLEKALNMPSLTYDNVQRYLAQCDRDTLATLFYNSAMVKVAEIMREERLRDQQAQAANQ